MYLFRWKPLSVWPWQPAVQSTSKDLPGQMVRHDVGSGMTLEQVQAMIAHVASLHSTQK